MIKSAFIFFILTIGMYSGLAYRVRVLRQTSPITYVDSQGHLREARPQPYNVYQYPQQNPHHHHHTTPTIHYVNTDGSATSRERAQTQLFNQLDGSQNSAVGTLASDHQGQLGSAGLQHSAQRLDDSFNRDRGFHNIYQKVEIGHSGEYGNAGDDTKHRSQHGQQDSYDYTRQEADASARGNIGGNLGVYTDYTQNYNRQRPHVAIPSTDRPLSHITTH